MNPPERDGNGMKTGSLPVGALAAVERKRTRSRKSLRAFAVRLGLIASGIHSPGILVTGRERWALRTAEEAPREATIVYLPVAGLARRTCHPISRSKGNVAAVCAFVSSRFERFGIVKPSSSSILIVLASLALVACGRSIGAPFDMAAANTLTPGVSTLDDAVAKLGTTTHRVGSARGTVAHWHYLRDRSGGATESASVTIMFDRNGRMVDILQRLEERPTAEN